MSERLPEDGVNIYVQHPGFTASDCPHRITVTQSWGDAKVGGFACENSGGHCLPESCKILTPIR